MKIIDRNIKAIPLPILFHKIEKLSKSVRIAKISFIIFRYVEVRLLIRF